MNRDDALSQLNGYLGDNLVPKFSDDVNKRLKAIERLPPDQQNAAYDTLLEDLPGMMADIDIFDRVNAAGVSDVLKKIYTQDCSHLAYVPDDTPYTNIRAIRLMEMRKDINGANKLFGIIKLDTRKYVSPLVPTSSEAQIMFENAGYDESEYRVQEHYGEGWEAFLQLNVDLDMWQEYSQFYLDQIMSKLNPLQDLPPSRKVVSLPPVAPTVEQPEVIPVTPPVQNVPPAPLMTPTTTIKGSGTVMVLDPRTGLQSRSNVSALSGGALLASNDVRTGDRDDKRRSLTVQANLNGLANWVRNTYRTYGDTVDTVESAEGGVISLTITGDINLWQQRTRMMRIPASLDIQTDPNANTMTVSYA